MSAYRAKDLLLVPGILSLARVPLAALFPVVAGEPPLAFGVLVAAGATDVLDGWYARRFGQTTPIGAVIDGITDKIFWTAVVATLALRGTLACHLVSPPSVALGVLLIASREIGELPLISWFLLSRKKRLGRPDNFAANAPGKVSTLLQFVTVTAAMFGWPFADALLVATAAVGLVTAALYWQRTIVTVRSKTRA